MGSVLVGGVVGVAVGSAVSTCQDDFPELGFVCGGISACTFGFIAGGTAIAADAKNHPMNDVYAEGYDGFPDVSAQDVNRRDASLH